MERIGRGGDTAFGASEVGKMRKLGIGFTEKVDWDLGENVSVESDFLRVEIWNEADRVICTV